MSLPEPYYEDVEAGIAIYHGDCREILPLLPKVDLVLTDPPYFSVKAEEWDNQWENENEFLSWLGSVLDLLAGGMHDWASIYLFTSPQMNWAIEGLVRNRFVFLNSIRWQKSQGWQNKQPTEAQRVFQTNWEGCLFAQRWSDDDTLESMGYDRACDSLHKKVYQPIGMYFREARVLAGLSYRQIAEHIGRSSALYLRWEEGSSLPNENDYERCQEMFPSGVLRRTYEELRRTYEELRRPFKLFDERMKSDSWEYDCVYGYAGKHPCEKPLALISHMIGTSSRASQTILDPFMGSGTTLRAAKDLGRKCIGIEIEEKYCEIAVKRLAQGVLAL